MKYNQPVRGSPLTGFSQLNTEHVDREPYIPGAFGKSAAKEKALIFYLKNKTITQRKERNLVPEIRIKTTNL